MRPSSNGNDKCLRLLQQIYNLFDKEAAILEKDIGVPICIPSCGKCCKENTVTFNGVEAKLAVMWVAAQKTKLRDEILGVCEDWLVKRDQYINIYRGPGTTQCSPAEIDKANNEGQYIFVKTPCPFLSEDKRCLIYPVRPIVCRAFGVTRVISRQVCPRPIGRYEAEEYRAYRQNSVACKEIVEKLEGMKLEMRGGYSEYNIYPATAIYSELATQKFMALLYHNLIPTARLLFFNECGILWQEQWQEIVDREAELRFLCSPIPEYNDPRDYTASRVQEMALVVAERKAEGEQNGEEKES